MADPTRDNINKGTNTLRAVKDAIEDNGETLDDILVAVISAAISAHHMNVESH